MVIVMEHAASEEQVQKVIESLVEVGYDVHRSSGIDYTVLGAVGVPHKPVDPRTPRYLLTVFVRDLPRLWTVTGAILAASLTVAGLFAAARTRRAA